MDASQFLLGSNFNFVGPLHLSSPFSLQKPFWAASHAALLQKNSLLERVLMMNLRSEENRKSSPDLELVAIVLHRGFVNGWKGGQTLPTSLRRQCPQWPKDCNTSSGETPLPPQGKIHFPIRNSIRNLNAVKLWQIMPIVRFTQFYYDIF